MKHTAVSSGPCTSRRRGSALVIALVVVSLVAALGAAYLSVATSTAKRQGSELDQLQAFYLAEAGLAEAFQAVRIGRSGQVGSDRVPAAHGDGLLWVDATETADDQVRLVSTALVGGARTALSLVVEPVPIPLGFFSDEDLIVESVLMVDGFDSEESPYEENLIGVQLTVDPSYPFLYVDRTNRLVFFEGSFYRFYAANGTSYWFDHEVSVAELAASPVFGTGTDYDIDGKDFTDHDWENDYKKREYDGVLAYFGTVPLPEQLAGLESIESGPTSGDGGLVGSNGIVAFVTPEGETAEVFGDVVPGPDGTVLGLQDAYVSGSTEPRLDAVELPPVEVPAVPLAAPVRHEGLLPLLVPPGASGFAELTVAADAELVLQGPSTVVIGQLTLEPGALLSLDTRDGDVALYVTAGLDLQPGSFVETSSLVPEELSVQVAEIPTGPAGPPVKLEATSQFHGTIYAPDAEVRVGGDFEVYGGIVARKLEIASGARLHFDRAELDDSPIPRVVGWRIVELPASIRAFRGGPHAALGIQPGGLPPLADAHALDAVIISIDYLDGNGVQRSYSGGEDLFDWDLVAEVLEVSRSAVRPKENEGQDDDLEGDDDLEEKEGPALGDVRPQVQDTLEMGEAAGFSTGGEVTVDMLIKFVPLTDDEWAGVKGFSDQIDPFHMQRLEDAHLAAGGESP